jgi:hypothetical protein
LRRKGLTLAVRRALELRQKLAHDPLVKIKALLARRDDDGRIRGAFAYHGAGPGRWTSPGVAFHNFKRDAGGANAKITAVMNGGTELTSPIETLGDIARAFVVAAPEHRLLIGDFSGIESRVLAWVSGQQSKVDQWAKFDRTGDPKDEPYFIVGQACGLPEEIARKTGKTADLAFGFGGSIGAWRRLAEDDETDDETILRYRDSWRAQNQITVRFWYKLADAARDAVRSPGGTFGIRRVAYRYDAPFLRLTLPSGRPISYPFAEIKGVDKFGRPQLTFMDNAGANGFRAIMGAAPGTAC